MCSTKCDVQTHLSSRGEDALFGFGSLFCVARDFLKGQGKHVAVSFVVFRFEAVPFSYPESGSSGFLFIPSSLIIRTALSCRHPRHLLGPQCSPEPSPSPSRTCCRSLSFSPVFFYLLPSSAICKWVRVQEPPLDIVLLQNVFTEPVLQVVQSCLKGYNLLTKVLLHPLLPLPPPSPAPPNFQLPESDWLAGCFYSNCPLRVCAGDCVPHRAL